MSSSDGVSRLGGVGPKLKTIDCVAQSLAVGPIFSGAVLGGALAFLSGGVGPITIILTLIGVLGIGYVVSELAKRYSGTGTVYEFIAHTLGKKAAVYAAGLYHLAVWVLAGPGIWIAGGIFAELFFDAHTPLDLPWWVWSLVIGAIATVVNILGVQLSVKTQLAIIVASVVPFLILAVKVIADGGVTGNSGRSFNPGNAAEGGSVMKGLLFSILMFVGFELAAALGEETENPKKSIPRAVIATILITGAFYLVTQYIGSIGSGGEGDSAIPFDFATLGKVYVGNWLGVLIELAIILDVIAVAIGFTAAGTRGMYTLARDGMAPKSWAKLSPKAIPANAIYSFAAATVIFVFVALAKYGTKAAEGLPNAAFMAFLIAATMGGMLVAFIYAMLCVGGLKLFGKTGNVAGIIAAVIGLVTAAGGVIAQFVDGTAPLGDALWGRHAGIAALVGAGLWLAYNIAKRPAAVEAAGQHTLHHDDATSFTRTVTSTTDTLRKTK
jgi:amino acid transporter